MKKRERLASDRMECASARRPSGMHMEDIERLRAVPLVPWARGKCPRCGATLVNDPLPHWCNPTDRPHVMDYEGL